MLTILELKNIAKKYQLKKGHNVAALKDFSFIFPKTGMFFILGKSGSGKSSLLNILGLLDNYDSGEFLIDGKDAKELSEKAKDEFRCQSIGFIFQEFCIIDKYTIGKNVSLPLEIQQNEDTDKQVTEVLAKVGLAGYENRNPSEISGGQKQRVAIARAIIKNPRIILADEPTGSLDSITGIEIFNILQELSKDRLVIVVSHDLEFAHIYGDQIIELKDGLIERIYPGDGGTEQVRILVDKIEIKDLELFNSLLAQGKKLTLVKNKDIVKDISKNDITSKENEKVEVKLPFRSVLKLSFLSLKSKWIRTFFTILISTFAIAFFGFSDLISTFNSNDLLVQELNREDKDFVGVGLEKIKDFGLYKEYDSMRMEEKHINEFDKMNLEAYPLRPFMSYPKYLPNTYQSFLPKRSGQYYDNSLIGYIECSDVSRIGLQIIRGRAPQNANEILITNFHLDCMKLFGFSNGRNTIENITDFSQVEEQIIFYQSGYSEVYELKIVGMVEIDLTPYKDLADIKNKVNKLTPELEELYAKFRDDVYNVNVIFVKQGFYDIFEAQCAATRVNVPKITLGNTTYDDRLYNAVKSLRITSSDFLRKSVAIKDDLKSLEDIKENKIIVSLSIMKKLVPDSVDYVGSVANYVRTYNVLGSMVNLEADVMSHSGNIVNNIEGEYEIIGVCSDYNYLFFSQNVVDELKTNHAFYYRVPASSHQERVELITALRKYGTFSIDDESFRFVCNTSSYKEIKRIEIYFALFVNVFSILAIVLCIFAIILTYTFISQSIMIRKKDIGILRSLGARKIDVANIFIVEGIVIATLEILLGVATCYFGYRILDHYFVNQLGTIAQLYNIVSFTIRQVALIAFSTIVAVALSIFIPIYRISNKQPVDAIRN